MKENGTNSSFLLQNPTAISVLKFDKDKVKSSLATMNQSFDQMDEIIEESLPVDMHRERYGEVCDGVPDILLDYMPKTDSDTSVSSVKPFNGKNKMDDETQSSIDMNGDEGDTSEKDINIIKRKQHIYIIPKAVVNAASSEDLSDPNISLGDIPINVQHDLNCTSTSTLSTETCKSLQRHSNENSKDEGNINMNSSSSDCFICDVADTDHSIVNLVSDENSSGNEPNHLVSSSSTCSNKPDHADVDKEETESEGSSCTGNFGISAVNRGSGDPDHCIDKESDSVDEKTKANDSNISNTMLFFDNKPNTENFQNVTDSEKQELLSQAIDKFLKEVRASVEARQAMLDNLDVHKPVAWGAEERNQDVHDDGQYLHNKMVASKNTKGINKSKKNSKRKSIDNLQLKVSKKQKCKNLTRYEEKSNEKDGLVSFNKNAEGPEDRTLVSYDMDDMFVSEGEEPLKTCSKVKPLSSSFVPATSTQVANSTCSTTPFKNEACSQEVKGQQVKGQGSGDTGWACSAGPSIYTCDYCTKMEKTAVSMVDHLKSSCHYSASLCTARVERDGTYEILHVEKQLICKIEQNFGKAFEVVCSICQEVFQDIYMCGLHSRLKHGCETGDYTLCPVVKKETVTVDCYQRCENCDNKFINLRALKAHLTTNQGHKKKVEKKLKVSPDCFTISVCPYCQVRYDQHQMCRTHVLTHKGQKETVACNVSHVQKPQKGLKLQLQPFCPENLFDQLPVELSTLTRHHSFVNKYYNGSGKKNLIKQIRNDLKVLKHLTNVQHKTREYDPHWWQKATDVKKNHQLGLNHELQW